MIALVNRLLLIVGCVSKRTSLRSVEDRTPLKTFDASKSFETGYFTLNLGSVRCGAAASRFDIVAGMRRYARAPGLTIVKCR